MPWLRYFINSVVVQSKSNNNYKSIINQKMEEKKKVKVFNYKEQYGVIVICENENEQKAIFEELQKKGLKLKVVTV